MSFRPIIAILCVLFILSSCADASNEEAKNNEVREELTSVLIPIGKAGFNKLAENEALEFYMDAATTQFYVKNKLDNETYYSNPENWDTNASIKDDAVKSDLGSVFSLTYYTDAGASFSMNAHRDSVILQQFSILSYPAAPNRITVKYTVGPNAADNILPAVISKEVFDEYVLNSEALTKTERAEILKGYRLLDKSEIMKIESQTNRDAIYKTYPHVDEMPLYEMRATTNNNMKKRLREHILKTELTIEIIEEDLLRIEPAVGDAKKPTFYITVDYVLDGDGLVVTVPRESYESPPKFYLSNIRLLPYFNTIEGVERGMIFVPDGSGAVIDTQKNHPAEFSSLSIPLYGREIVKDMTVQSNTTGIISNSGLFPVYGISNNGGGVFAILEKGDAVARIIANSSTQAMPYNSVYADFNVMASDYLSFGTARLNAFSYVFPKSPIEDDLRVRYSFLSGENADYNGMAKTYRDYLERNGTIKRLSEDEAYPLLIEFVGGLVKKQSVLGVMTDRVLPLTSYTDALDITKELLDDGVSAKALTVRYNAWSNKGYFNTSYENIRLDGTLGGKSTFNRLTEFMNESGIDFYPDINLMYVGKDSLFDGFTPSGNASRTIISQVATVSMMNAIRMTSYTDWGTRYILSPAYTEKIVRQSLSDAEKLNIKAVSFGEYGRQLQSDYKKKNLITRDTAMKMAVDNLAYAKESGFNVMLEGAAPAYLPHTDFIAKMPTSDSLFKATDYSVPFTQIVLHGYVSYGGESRNLAADTKRELLQAAEGGAALSYTWIAAPDSVLINTELADVFYSANYKNWYADAIENYEKFNAVFDKLHTETIENHEILEGGLTKTTYESGNAVIVNFSDSAKTVDGETVPAYDFILVKGGGEN
ncbi:hypothetical protein FACS189490_00670 [Clostridia bacterium]|nr:hypothetical protein FACS189490_00670 [Clostridia bacterium]